jgi:hypothetical protein
MRDNPKDAVETHWMCVNVWRFLFKDAADAKRNYESFRDHFGLHPKCVAARKRGKLPPARASVLRRGQEVRIRLEPADWTPDLGVILDKRLGRKTQLLVHFDNMRFYCEWFVYRNTVYDLTFDGKCSYNSRTKKCYLNPMVP